MSASTSTQASQQELVTLRREGQIAIVTLQRPDVLNCLSFETLVQLRAHVAALARDEQLRVVIFTGAGERAFCAGADLKERKTMPLEKVPLFVNHIRSAFDEIEALPMPTVAAMNGVAFGGGVELALACDLRILAANAQLGLTEVTLAIIPGAGGTQRLPRLIGKARAKELILTGRKITPQYALEIGLANHVAGPGEVMGVALHWAEEIASNGPVAVRAAKAAIDQGCELPLREGLALENRCYERVIPTRDRLEALAAFAEKRKPVYEGR
ncbi:MAG: enoyl-CoA hydratase/isomerase family protein [Planctomycetes bacterium]|nr:enoyl-CoA hydratase/isomerase family protein [Planctomycetota bacterium]